MPPHRLFFTSITHFSRRYYLFAQKRLHFAQGLLKIRKERVRLQNENRKASESGVPPIPVGSPYGNEPCYPKGEMSMKKRIVSAVMALILCLTLLPATVLADDTGTASSVVEVSTMENLNAALSNANVTEIHITGDIVYSDSLNSRKTIYIDNGATLTLSANTATVSGTIVNNGTIQVKSR